ncbi:hypothetical protein PW52_05730 [Tamlana sedimentorum]|uniref:Tail sheath protein C-terminal domain-containing protein n=1 Tax=Neotamlana sedimentorum TaxID=1435349 RepID=A0A0D7WAE7_9FLAO|nr:phage tail sheath C-terminal domain-containing protein [Tamlana sedimentorum]KJD36111.1 hypothetical protein PW52_05730 [Tamlana sedimentorum]
MAAKYKTPGIYINEINNLPNGIAQVETAIPAFIGYTEKAEFNDNSLINKPTKISSLTEYINCFGRGFLAKCNLLSNKIANNGQEAVKINGNNYIIDFANHQKAYMYASLKLFFNNGGVACYVVSIETYQNKDNIVLDNEKFVRGLNLLETQIEPSLVVIPDAVNLSKIGCYHLYQKVLQHCSNMKNRVAVLDVFDGFKPISSQVITEFRQHIGSLHLNYGVAYYPWLETSINSKNDITFKNINLNLSELSNLLPEEAAKILIEEFINESQPINGEENLHEALLILSPSYVLLIEAVKKVLNILPPSGAMAGIYAMVDQNKGVWKAPANVSLNSVIKPTIPISNSQQEILNVDATSGKSINAIRSFVGKGTLVWGARTLNGNSNEYRYINVVRTLIMVEQSVKNGLEPFVFEPNDANTWKNIKSKIENFLLKLWRQGALAGSKPSDAFFVNIGLGVTMTANDVIQGKLIIELGLAIQRPAEFVILHLQQQLQNS